MEDTITPTDGAPRTLVVFADGTSNAFARSRTNIWQLYCALEKDGDRQIARYIPGVGTSSNSIIRMIDGAIGFGVPLNVRKLYRFLCWNWRPGDRIVLFGFSRGAFTVRTLAGMIAHQGLMPRERNGEQVGTAEMRRNTLGAWRAYRAASATKVWPTVTLMRRLRDGAVALKRRLSGQDRHAVLEAAIAGTARGPVWPKGQKDTAFLSEPGAGVRVGFLGVFDTVEAFGMPVEELRLLIGRLLYPLSFSNGICAPSVLCARHALAVDEERLSFRNVSFDPPKNSRGEPQEREWQDIGQRWFPGVHSDIGGGYPDDHGAVPPLQWMLDEAIAAGLHFGPAIRDDINARRFDLAPIHDSRKGLAAAYRYQPRRIGPNEEVDPTLLTKLRGGADLYGPISPRDGCNIAGHAPLPPMPAPYKTAIDGMVFRYRLSNRIVIAILVFLFFCPWYYLPATDAALASLASPGWKEWWLRGLWASGWHGAALVLLGLAFYLPNWGLKDRIRDTAAAGWQGGTQAAPRVSAFWRKGARIPPAYLEWAFAGIMIALAVGAVWANRDRLRQGTLARAHCIQPGGTEMAVGEARAMAFDPAHPCPATGIRVREGQHYAIRLQIERGFCDAGIPVPAGGIASPNLLMQIAERARRVDAPWLAPVVQIGADGPGSVIAGTTPPDGADWPCPATARTGPDVDGTFTAGRSGPLFVYANDIGILPGLFYANNTGRARLSMERTR